MNIKLKSEESYLWGMKDGLDLFYGFLQEYKGPLSKEHIEDGILDMIKDIEEDGLNGKFKENWANDIDFEGL